MLKNFRESVKMIMLLLEQRGIFMKKRLMSQEFEKLNKALCGGWNGTFLVGGGAIV